VGDLRIVQENLNPLRTGRVGPRKTAGAVMVTINTKATASNQDHDATHDLSARHAQ